jgi:hypothetical protein
MPPPTREDVEEALRALDVPGARAAVQTIRLYLIHEDRPSRRRDVTAETEEQLRQTHGQVAEVAIMLDPDVCPDAWGLRDAAAKVLRENAALKADNAALVDMLRLAHGDLCVAYCMPRETATGPIPALLAKPHPGAALLERMRKMEETLRTIARWDRETFPRVPDPANPQLTTSYGFAYGSNGERDYMRQIALDALEEK